MCEVRAVHGWGPWQWKLWLLRLGDQRPGEQAGGGVDAPLGEQGDFGGLDRDPVKEEVELGTGFYMNLYLHKAGVSP